MYVLIGGVPGGQTTLARQLAPLLDVPLIAKDAIKEALRPRSAHRATSPSRSAGVAPPCSRC